MAGFLDLSISKEFVGQEGPESFEFKQPYHDKIMDALLTKLPSLQNQNNVNEMDTLGAYYDSYDTDARISDAITISNPRQSVHMQLTFLKQDGSYVVEFFDPNGDEDTLQMLKEVVQSALGMVGGRRRQRRPRQRRSMKKFRKTRKQRKTSRRSH
jgi:hypothetical protein